MKELMIDTETLDVTPKAVVLSVAVVPFTQKNGPDKVNTYYAALDIQPQLDVGRTISESTLKFWMEQDKEVRDAAFEGGAHPLELLNELLQLYNGYDLIWANGPAFDLIILEDLARDFQLFNSTPWKFWQGRDVRSMREETVGRDWVPDNIPEDILELGSHHPIYDCYVQIEVVRKARESILPAL